MHSLALRNQLEELITQLAEALKICREKSESRLTDESGRRRVLGTRHGGIRAGILGYALHEVIFEFHILRQIVFGVLEEEAPLGRSDRDIILDAVEQAVNDAASGFSDTLRDVQQHFAVTLTHDLRGPLTTAKAAAQIILRRPDRPELVEKSAFYVVSSMERLDQMIRDILNASKLRSGEGLTLKLVECDLAALVHEVVDEFRMSDPERFVIRATDGVAGSWDPEGLRRVLQNLVANAVKYGMPTSPITITLEEAGQVVRLTVHNGGNPIPAEKQAVLFESYRRLDEDGEISGWGLGLYLTRGIVEAHGGSIRLESSPESGTSFIVELPRSVPALKAG